MGSDVKRFRVRMGRAWFAELQGACARLDLNVVGHTEHWDESTCVVFVTWHSTTTFLKWALRDHLGNAWMEVE